MPFYQQLVRIVFVLPMPALLVSFACISQADEQTLVINGTPSNPLRFENESKSPQIALPKVNPQPSHVTQAQAKTSDAETESMPRLETPTDALSTESSADVSVPTETQMPSVNSAAKSLSSSNKIQLNEDTDNPNFLHPPVDHDAEPPMMAIEEIDAENLNSLVLVDELPDDSTMSDDAAEAEVNSESDFASDGEPSTGHPPGEELSADNISGDTAETDALHTDAPEQNLASRPIMRRPKPIVIEPIGEEDAMTEQVRVEGSDNVKSKPVTARANDRAITSLPKRMAVDSLDSSSTTKLDLDSTALTARAARVDATLQYYVEHPESVAARSPWAVMHTLLPYGMATEMTAGKQRVNAIAWMCANRLCKTQTIFSPAGNSFRPNVGGGVQGHNGQFLAMMAQSKVPSSYPIYVANRKYSIANLVRYEMATCKPKSELTFKLIGLTYYLGTQQSWRSSDRQTWNVERLVAEEMAQPVNGAACGGTHRLMGLSFALNQRRVEGLPLTGSFGAADRYIRDYKDYAWTLQNPDGSFSTNWFESRGADPDDDRKVQTSGHILEWLIYASSPQELENPRIDRAVDYLLSQVYDRRDHKWAIGPRGHTLRALVLYREKVLRASSATEAAGAPSVASTPSSNVAPKRR